MALLSKDEIAQQAIQIAQQQGIPPSLFLEIIRPKLDEMEHQDLLAGDLESELSQATSPSSTQFGGGSGTPGALSRLSQQQASQARIAQSRPPTPTTQELAAESPAISDSLAQGHDANAYVDRVLALEEQYKNMEPAGLPDLPSLPTVGDGVTGGLPAAGVTGPITGSGGATAAGPAAPTPAAQGGGTSAQAIDQFLAQHGSPMAGLGNVFVSEASKNGIDPTLLVGIANAESSLGKSVKPGTNNPFGWGPHIPFGSWQEGIATVARGLRTNYFDKGYNDPVALGNRYVYGKEPDAPDIHNSPWLGNVEATMAALGSGFGKGQATQPIAETTPEGGELDGQTPEEFDSEGPVTSEADAISRVGPLSARAVTLAARDPKAEGESGNPSYTMPLNPETGLPKGATASPQAAAILSNAAKQIGQPYVWGGESRKEGGFDCSGLIQWAYQQAGISIPRTTYEQIKVGRPISWGSFRPGDLIFSNNGGHVVMYVGGGKVIAAPHTGAFVHYQPVSDFKSSFSGARRIL